MSEWSIVYEKAIRDDGSLWFPERLSFEFLEKKKRDVGSYIFANQYQNEVIPLDKQTFKKEWRKYYKTIPDLCHRFVFIDPAISTADDADFTAIVVVAVDVNNNWYVLATNRYRMNPTEIINKLFEVHEQFSPIAIGIEEVAYQKALLYMISEEMRRRGKIIPVSGIRPSTDKTKEMRILSLVPRLEWGSLFLREGLDDLEDEMDKFPRGRWDDLLDALAYIDYVAFKPTLPRETKELRPGMDGYEQNYIEKLMKGRNAKLRRDPFSA